MKISTSIILLLITAITQAQNTRSLDTIYANNNKTVSLFFPKPIRQGIVGRSNFVFTHNKEKEQYFGLLQATPGLKSNLLTITNDGQVYSYILKYSKTLPKLNYFIKIEESIGNEIPKEKKVQAFQKHPNTIKKTIVKAKDQYAKNCASFLKNSRRNLNKSKQKYQIRLVIKDIAYHKNTLYYLVEIHNKSKIDYDVNYLRFFTENKSSLTKKSSQMLQIKPLYKHQFPERIRANSKSEFVIVLPKFSVGKEKNVFVELNEDGGERDLGITLSK
ncbi:MAG: DUF4138 domain-containing protein [Bacteroidota bacterium]